MMITMKNIRNLIGLPFVLIFMLLTVSCTNELIKLNEDTKHATTAGAETFFSNATKNLSDNLNSIEYRATGPGITRLWAQQLTSVTYLEGVTYIPEFSWSALYEGVLNNLKESSETLSEAEEVTPTVKNQLSMVEIMTVFTYANLVESYGNIPYSEALDFENPRPKYDDGETVYMDLLDRLSNAISEMDENADGFGAADLVYGGDVQKWIKFGNSLKLRMGMRIIDALPADGIKAVSEASTNLISSNDENALFRYLPDYPNTNPWWSFLVREGLKYFVGTETFLGKMNDLEDPRREVFFTPLNGEYKGAKYGVTQNYASYSREGAFYREPDLPVIFMDYAQVEFLLAEAAERGISGISDPESHYNKAIKASFEYYGLSEDDTHNYLNQSHVKYSSAEGNWKEKIGVQKWLALFDQGFEAWTEYRRLGFPKLSAPGHADSDIVPLRFLYPISEQTLNGDNYKEAASAIGGDTYSTGLFWDVE